jgi:hypothetical protein
MITAIIITGTVMAASIADIEAHRMDEKKPATGGFLAGVNCLAE